MTVLLFAYGLITAVALACCDDATGTAVFVVPLDFSMVDWHWT